MSDVDGRIIDHVVMPVEDLAFARLMFEALGFAVAPDAVHPFGTGNACVFLADGTYIEPLAVLDRDQAESEAANGNVFLRRDLAYRLRHSLPGLSGMALQSSDAVADRRAFIRAGYDGGDLLEFGRRFDRPDGPPVDLRFRLAFAVDRAFAGTFVFACQRLTEFTSDRTALTRHPNGVSGLSRLVYAANDPMGCRPFLSGVLGTDTAVANSLGFSMPAGNATIDVFGPDGMAARYGETNRNRDELRLAGLVLNSNDLDRVQQFAESGDFDVQELLGRLIVRLSDRADFFLAFERSKE